MSKKVIILVLSSEHPPYDSLMECSRKTWDSISVDGCETIFYTGASLQPNTDTFISFPIGNSIFDMGRKNLAIFEYCLANKEFDFIYRVNASCYVHKVKLMEFISELPTENVFAGLKVEVTPPWIFGGGSFIISKDVIQKIVDNKEYLDHTLMEDQGLSYLINKLEIPYTNTKACSIDRVADRWLCMCYGTEGFYFDDFSELGEKNEQFGFRVKQDSDRSKDLYIMQELFRVLN